MQAMTSHAMPAGHRRCRERITMPPAAAAAADSFQHFELEAWQSLYETTVRYNLADSGVNPVCLESSPFPCYIEAAVKTLYLKTQVSFTHTDVCVH